MFSDDQLHCDMFLLSCEEAEMETDRIKESVPSWGRDGADEAIRETTSLNQQISGRCVHTVPTSQPAQNISDRIKLIQHL